MRERMTTIRGMKPQDVDANERKEREFARRKFETVESNRIVQIVKKKKKGCRRIIKFKMKIWQKTEIYGKKEEVRIEKYFH